MLYKDDGDNPKKKVHKKTVSNIDDFLETGSPIQSSSKELSGDSKKLYEREKAEKLYKKEKLYEKQKLYERDKSFDKERLYEKDKSYLKDHMGKSSDLSTTSDKMKHRKESGINKYVESTSSSCGSKSESSIKYMDNMKKQKLSSSASKLDRPKELVSGDHKSEKLMKKHSSEMDCETGERKRLHSESGSTMGDLPYKKSKEKIRKHIKRTDDSDDDMAPEMKKSKERVESSRRDSERTMEDSEDDEDYDYNHTKKVRKHSMGMDASDSREKYYVRDERDAKEYPKIKDHQLKKQEYKEKDESQKVKSHMAVQSSGFIKSMMKESNLEQKIACNKKLADPRVKTSSDLNRSNDGSSMKKANHSFTSGEYKHEKYRERKISSGSDDHSKEVSENF